MAELLVKAVDAAHPDPVADLRGSYKKGDIVVAMPDGHVWGSAERPPAFVLVRCPELELAVALERLRSWDTDLEWGVVGTSLALDGARIRIYNATVGASGAAAVARETVEAFLADWNAVVVAVGPNEVRFDMTVYRAATSRGFWDRDVGDGSRFSELAYAQDTGVHRLAFDYAGMLAPPDPRSLEALVAERGGTVISNVDGLITFEVDRATVRARVRAAMKEVCDATYRRRRYYFAPAQVDSALGQGGFVDLTLTQLQANVHDRMTE